MLKSAFTSIRSVGIILFLITGGISSYAFQCYTDKQQCLTWSNGCLDQAYDYSTEAQLKKWDISITNDCFLRFRKTYNNGKQEYYSFKLNRFSDLDYWGTAHSGLLRIKTQANDIIVQTYNDPKGNIDSMTTVLSIPAKNMEPERLDSLRQALLQLKML
ncbi:hypothetical protein HH214_04620 [Mucilaginibacter robiniae]|uniref:Uncharacterized protein n=1 Tax=Mucilaginibacter robiniae TaxID=2728022 RepID=A0A7L5DVV0_9SPHI|nr:hypothetical protein [Mucilaginibacter robiniae]QJD95212.1 hypothetical protein HH214_04620 [Mucilaginibacter robiniae]